MVASRRIAQVVLVFVAMNVARELVLSMTPMSLNDSVTPASRAWADVTSLVWLAALVVMMVRQPLGRLWLVVLLFTALNQVWWLYYLPIEPRVAIEVPVFLGGELWAAVFIHLVLAYPSGHLEDRFDSRLVGFLYVFAVAFKAAAMLMVTDPCDAYCGDPVALGAPPLTWDVVHYSSFALIPVLMVIALVELGRHWRRSSPAGRRVLAPLLVAAPLWCATVFAGYFADTFLDWPARVATHSVNALTIVQNNLIPVAILLGVLLARLARGNVARLAVELGRGIPTGQLQAALARAVRDPTLELAFPAPGGDGLVDADGRAFAWPDASRRTITRVEQDGQLLAVLTDDPQAVEEDPGLVEAVGSVARFALANERLAAQVRAQLEEVRASRARIVEAGDAERRRVERDLHDGAQQRLTALAVRLDVARESGAVTPELVASATEELRAAVGEVRDLSRGLHPPILTESGLEAAIESLAERTSVPVTVAAPPARFPAEIEAAAYFVVAEALTNVTRYAAATRAAVEIGATDRVLSVSVRDDGAGGADPAAGSGLRGLAERVGALGGRLTVTSPTGAGTTVTAELPLPG